MGLSSLSDITISLSVLLTSLVDVISVLLSWVRSYRTECSHPLHVQFAGIVRWEWEVEVPVTRRDAWKMPTTFEPPCVSCHHLRTLANE